MNWVSLKKFTVALTVGALTISIPVNFVNAQRLHDPKIMAKNIDTRIAENIETAENQENFSAEISTLQFAEFENFLVPTTVSSLDASIIGTPLATQRQCVKYLMSNNPNPKIGVSAEEIVAYYYEEGMREGIRPDVAFAQALKETGFFRYGGTVTPDQNNYCGLGTTSATIKGNYFANPKMGVRAHIQHLLAYSSTRRPTTEIVDPRYNIVRKVYGANTLQKWSDLNGRWAVPGNGYGQEILSMFQAILIQ